MFITHFIFFLVEFFAFDKVRKYLNKHRIENLKKENYQIH